jgi:hypothetical protein
LVINSEVGVRRISFGLVCAVLVLASLVGCTTPVAGIASSTETPSSSPRDEDSPFADGADPRCLAGDGCPDDPVPVGGPVCGPLPDAMTAFDTRARAAFTDGQVSTNGPTASLVALTAVVDAVVETCGFQVMVDVANQYPDPLFTWLGAAAVTALDEVGALPEGLRCADLSDLGFTPKDAVDYWFRWGGPDLMDRDLDGTPCETVWSDVQRYMPQHY